MQKLKNYKFLKDFRISNYTNLNIATKEGLTKINSFADLYNVVSVMHK